MAANVQHVQLEEDSGDENAGDIEVTTATGKETLNIEISESLKKQCLAHEKALQDCLSILSRVKICAIMLSFDYFLRSNIFVLYARTLDNYPDESVVGVVVYCSYVVSGLFSIVNGIIGMFYTVFILIMHFCKFFRCC